MENSHEYPSIDQYGCRIGARVKVSGIVSDIQNHGGLLFIVIRNQGDLIRAMIIPDNKYAYAMSQKIEKGYLVEIMGVMKECPTSAQNISSRRKEIEIDVEKIAIVSARNDEEANRLVGILAKINTPDKKKQKKII